MKIEIIGRKGEGKSTLALKIQRMLSQTGVALPGRPGFQHYVPVIIIEEDGDNSLRPDLSEIEKIEREGVVIWVRTSE